MVVDLLAVFVMQLAAGVLGEFAFRAMGGTRWAADGGLATRVALGNGLLALLTMVAGAAGLLSPVAFWVMDGALAAVAVRRLFTCRHLLRLPSGMLPRGGIHLLVACILGGFALLAAAHAVAPPVQKDVVGYQFAIVRLYQMDGRIAFAHNNWPFHFPQVANFSFLHAFVLSGETAATIQDGVFWLGCLVAVARLCPPISGARVLAACLFACIEVVSTHAGSGFVDLATGMYGLFALGAASQAIDSVDAPGRLRWALVSGLLAGLAAGSKLTGLLVPIAIGATLLASRAGPGSIAMACVGTIMMGFPTYAMNWIQAGNPVYPFFHGVFGGRELTPEFSSLIFGMREAGSLSLADIALRLVTMPWELTARWRVAGEANVLGPGLLALLPLVPWSAPSRVLARRLGTFALVFLAPWFLVSPMIRLAHPAWGALCALAAVTAFTIPWPGRMWRSACIAPVVAACLLSLVVAVRWDWMNGTLPCALGRTDRAAHISRGLKHYFTDSSVDYGDLLDIGTSLQEGDRVFTTVPYKYYIPASHEDLGQLLEREAPREGASGEQWARFAISVLRSARERRIRYLLLDSARNPRVERLLTEFEALKRLETIRRTRTVVLLGLRTDGGD